MACDVFGLAKSWLAFWFVSIFGLWIIWLFLRGWYFGWYLVDFWGLWYETGWWLCQTGQERREGIVSSCNKEDLCPSYPCPGSNFHKEFLRGRHTHAGRISTPTPHLIFTRASSNIQKTDKDRQIQTKRDKDRQRETKADKDRKRQTKTDKNIQKTYKDRQRQTKTHTGRISHLIFTTSSSSRKRAQM